MKNSNINVQTGQTKDVIYCTDCGMELDNFELSEMISDYKLMVKKFANCKKEVKFSGDLCSKIFSAFKSDQTNSEDENLEFF